MSMGDKPVTQTAEVATNKAFTKLMDSFSGDENGKKSSVVPKRIKSAKLVAIIRVGVKIFRKIFCSIYFRDSVSRVILNLLRINKQAFGRKII